MTLRTACAALAVALLLPLSACDEVGADSADEAVVISDAQAASQKGDYTTATTLLERALVRNPESAPVRTELATTVLASRDLNLLDVDRIAQFVVTSSATAAAGRPASRAAGGTCKYATDPGAEAFDPTSVVGFQDIRASKADVDRVITLLEPLLPASLKTFDTCTTIGADGRLVYDRAAAAAEMRAKGLSNATIGRILAANALARFLNAYITVTTELPQQTAWYRLKDGSIGVCADDEDALRTDAEGAIETLGTAVVSLDLRARSFGGATDLVDLALDAVGDIREAFDTFCASQR